MHIYTGIFESSISFKKKINQWFIAAKANHHRIQKMMARHRQMNNHRKTSKKVILHTDD